MLEERPVDVIVCGVAVDEFVDEKSVKGKTPVPRRFVKIVLKWHVVSVLFSLDPSQRGRRKIMFQRPTWLNLQVPIFHNSPWDVSPSHSR